MGVDLRGDGIGEFGVLVDLDSEKIVFVCGDGVWVSKRYEKLVFGNKIVGVLRGDGKCYGEKIEKLDDLSEI